MTLVCPKCGIDNLFPELVAVLPWGVVLAGKKRRFRKRKTDLLPLIPKKGVSVTCGTCKAKLKVTRR